MIELYLYETCPFCTKVRMALGAQQLDYRRVYLLADDRDTPRWLTGRPGVPILYLDGRYRTESDELVDALSGRGRGLAFASAPLSAAAGAWRDAVAGAYDALCYPRFARLGPPELSSDGAMRYFAQSRSERLGQSLEEAMARSGEYVAQVMPALAAVAPHVDPAAVAEGRLSADDFLLFPALRNLALVDGLALPGRIAAYLAAVADTCGVPLFVERY
ncbi:glutaredoxin 2 [Sphingomonas flavalba]|uniref:glutaredoxin 2 n=1 Tax=Sphingomonas flavalba TaxID=2559804 RepID=UPI0039DF88CC